MRMARLMWLQMMQVPDLLQLLLAFFAYSINEEVVGLAAKQSRIRNISNSVMKVKHILGRRYTVVPGLSLGSILLFVKKPVLRYQAQ